MNELRILIIGNPLSWIWLTPVLKEKFGKGVDTFIQDSAMVLEYNRGASIVIIALPNPDITPDLIKNWARYRRCRTEDLPVVFMVNEASVIPSFVSLCGNTTVPLFNLRTPSDSQDLLIQAIQELLDRQSISLAGTKDSCTAKPPPPARWFFSVIPKEIFTLCLKYYFSIKISFSSSKNTPKPHLFLTRGKTHATILLSVRNYGYQNDRNTVLKTKSESDSPELRIYT